MLGQDGREHVEGQDVQLPRHGGEQHRPQSGVDGGADGVGVVDAGDAVADEVLDLDAAAVGLPAFGDGDEDGPGDVLPGRDEPVDGDGLGEDVPHGLGVHGEGGAGEPAGPGARLREAEQPAAAAGRTVEHGGRGGGAGGVGGERGQTGRARRECQARGLRGAGAVGQRALHDLEPCEVARGVAAVAAGHVSGGFEPVATGPGPQRGGRDAEPAGDGGDRQREGGRLPRLHPCAWLPFHGGHRACRPSGGQAGNLRRPSC